MADHDPLEIRRILYSIGPAGLAPTKNDPSSAVARVVLEGVLKVADQEDQSVKRFSGLLWLADRLDKARGGQSRPPSTGERRHVAEYCEESLFHFSLSGPRAAR